MNFEVPYISDSSPSSSPVDYFPATDYLDTQSDPPIMDSKTSEGNLASTGIPSAITSEYINNLSSLVTAIKNATPETQFFLKELMEGRNPKIQDQRQETDRSSNSKNEVMKRDATFEKWNGESLTWTPHYYLLKTQCRVYKPLLVTEEAVCMKIYECIPEPQRQRICGY